MPLLPICAMLLCGPHAAAPTAAATRTAPECATAARTAILVPRRTAVAASSPVRIAVSMRRQAPAPAAPPPATAPPAAPEGPTPATTMTVTIQIPNLPVDPKFAEYADAFPPSPIQVNPIALQNVLSGVTPPSDTPLAAKIRAAYLQIAPQQRLDNEPSWRDSINPVFWVNRTRALTADWWQAYKTSPAYLHAQPTEMYPFAYDFGTETQPPTRVKARQFNNDGLDALLLQGDFVKAADQLYKSVTADPTYPYGPYNAGVLQMCLYNPEAAIKMFLTSDRRGGTVPGLSDRAALYRENMRRMIILLLNNKGSQRRIYAEDLDAAWVMANIGQYRAAALFAGQAASVDSDEERPEAHLLIALISAEQNKPAESVRWLQYCLERCKGSSLKTVNGLLREAMTADANAGAPPPAATTATPAAPEPATPAPATPAPATPAPATPAPAPDNPAPATPAPAPPPQNNPAPASP